MKIFKSKQTKEADNYTIENEPISSIDLMERAASFATKKILELYPKKTRFKIFVGPGNNGGDGLVIARLLADADLSVYLYIVKFTNNFSKDFCANLERLSNQNKVNIKTIKKSDELPKIGSEEIVIDAVFGSGLTRLLSDFPKEVVDHVNNSDAQVLSIDSPSGLFSEENPTTDRTVVRADHTLTFQYPSIAFFFPENEVFVGQFHVIDIVIHRNYINNTETKYHFTLKEDIKLKKRKKFSHKGNYGHALIFAGTYGKAGASVLTVKAAQRSGAGLVSAAVPHCNYEILQITSPETMLYIDSSDKYLSVIPEMSNHNAVAIGPGIGFATETKELLKKLVTTFDKPIVFDADAITILSEIKDWLDSIPEGSIFTPHPKEFERLVGKSENNYQRMKMQIDFAERYNCFMILKGAHTSIACPDKSVYFNSTGNPGMATGGSGDVLTGIIVSLLAQKYKPKDEAIISVFIHGLAGDLAAKKLGYNSLIASDIIDFIPDALKMIK